MNVPREACQIGEVMAGGTLKITPGPFIGKRADLKIIDDMVFHQKNGKTDFLACYAESMLAPKEKNMIGGETCHLCGAHKTMVSTVQQFTKKWNQTARHYMSVTTYACGTTVTKKRDKTSDLAPHVRIGSKCIEVS